jgi:DNA-binding NarL/FixJ family response regulator
MGEVCLRVVVVAEDLLARAGLAALISSVADIEVAAQVMPAPGLADDLDLYSADAAVIDLGYDPQKLSGLLASLEDTPALLLLSDAALAYGVMAGIPAGSLVALLLREGDPRRLAHALAALDAGLVTLDPAIAAALLPSGNAAENTPVERLTAREQQVLQLMAAGLTNKAIAHDLSISANTVKYHVNAILGKLDAQSRTEAVVRGGRLGLVML